MKKIGSQQPDRSALNEAIRDGKVHTCVGVVSPPSSGEDHYQIVTDDNGNPVDVLVELLLQPLNQRCSARLGAVCGGPGAGIWKIPPEGAECAVLVPHGEVEGGPMIVAVLSCRDVPHALDADKLVMINPGDIILASKNGKVFIGSEDGSGTKAIAYKDGQVDLGTWQVTVGSGAVTAVTWVPPGGGTPVTLPVAPAPPVALTGKITDGSPKAEVKT